MTQQAIDYSRKWYVIAAMATGIFLSTIDGSIVLVVLPTLVRELNTDFPVVQWVVLAYLLSITTMLLMMGRLGDMLGKRRIYASGMVIFTIGSVLCGLSPGVYWLIGFRVLQGLGGSMMMALGAAITTEAFPPTERGKALGISSTMVAVGIVTGPVIGGLILDAFSWHWIFFMNVPVAAVGIFLVLRYVQAVDPPGGQRFDFVGAGLLFLSLLLLLLAFTAGQREGFTQPSTLLYFGASAVLLAVFIVVEARAAHPMVDLRLFRNQNFRLNLLTGFIVAVAMEGVFVLLPFYLGDMRGFPPRTVGLLLSVSPIAMGSVAPVAGWVSDRIGTRRIIAVSLLVMVTGFYSISTISLDTPIVPFLLCLILLDTSIGLFESPYGSAVMGAVSSAQLGIASGLMHISMSLGWTVGIAVLSSVWTTRVGARLGDLPTGGATAAPVGIQMAALSDTYLAATLLVVGALGLGLWNLCHRT